MLMLPQLDNLVKTVDGKLIPIVIQKSDEQDSDDKPSIMLTDPP